MKAKILLVLFAVCFTSTVKAVDEVDYDKIVDILKVDVVPPKKKGGKSTVELTFNLHPALPNGAKVEFMLLYRFLPFESGYYTLKTENRKNLKFEWEPKKKCPVDTYELRTLLPVDLQTARVAKELKAKEKIFRPDRAPWQWNYPEMKVKIGTDEDLAAEEREVKAYFKEKVFGLLDLNNEFVEDHMTPFEAGEKYVRGGKVEAAPLGAFVDTWTRKMGELQLGLAEYEQKHPGLFAKNEAAHFHLQRLSRLVAKRCFNELKKVMQKYGAQVSDLNLKGHKGFDRRESGRVSSRVLGQTFDTINKLVPFVDEEEGAEADAEEKDEK